MKVLVTGSNGFVGRHLVCALLASGHEVVAASRSECRLPAGNVRWVSSPDLNGNADWFQRLEGADAVVHLAALAHVLRDECNPVMESVYHQVNCEGTFVLATQAASFGVKHFVFLSSCHAVAARSDVVLTERTPPNPSSPYGRSKLAAEAALRQALRAATCTYTILRPPLVYGPGNLANFARLITLIKSGIPLPFGSVRNIRSLVSVQNLVDLILTCIANPRAANRIYFPSDMEDISTPGLIRSLAEAWGLPARLFRVPPSFLSVASRFRGLGDLGKLTSSLYVDSDPLRTELSWIPPYSLEEGLRMMSRLET